MDKEELDIAVEGNCREYYDYLLANDKFNNIINKIDSKEELLEEDWLYIIERLKILNYKSLEEEDKIDLGDRFYSLICRIGMTVFKTDSGIYNECLKMYKLIEFMKDRTIINKDLFDGFDIVLDNMDEESLGILLQQHKEAHIFRNNSKYYDELFEESISGIISPLERIQMNAATYSYEREKELVKKYKNVI